jgi:hypothetical protein
MSTNHPSSDRPAGAAPATQDDQTLWSDPQHIDNLSTDAFAHAMKVKLWRKRHFDGRGGWDKPDKCSIEHLWALLKEHVERGPELSNMTDVANFAMMIWNRLLWMKVGAVRWDDEYTR